LWDRHQWMMRTLQTPGRSASRPRTDVDVIREHHQFLRDDGGHVAPDAPWEERLAAKYYQSVVKEYAVADLSRYKEFKVGLRWRTEQEVISGKGQFECGSLSCSKRSHLTSYEVPFNYQEHGVAKQVLPPCYFCIVASHYICSIWTVAPCPMEEQHDAELHVQGTMHPSLANARARGTHPACAAPKGCPHFQPVQCAGTGKSAIVL
jgi:Folate-sensitive fragile site protein Fra10Ac1